MDTYRRLRTEYGLTALDAWRAVKHQRVRQVKLRLLGLPGFRALPIDRDLEIGPYTLEIRFHSDSDFSYDRDDFIVIERKYLPEYAQHHKGQWRVDGWGIIELTEWSEQKAYDYYKVKLGRARARQLAIESRRGQIARLRNIARGDLYYLSCSAQCKEIDFEDSLHGVQNDDEDSIRTFIEDAVESVLRAAQSFKVPT